MYFGRSGRHVVHKEGVLPNVQSQNRLEADRRALLMQRQPVIASTR